MLAEHVAEALAGAAPPWQVPARIHRAGGCSDGRMLLGRVRVRVGSTKALTAGPYQASEVLTRLRALGGGVDGGFDVDAYGGDLCLGSALGGVSGWFGVDVGGWFN